MNRKNGRPLENNKRVKIIETGKIYENYVEATKAIDGNRSCVYLCLKGDRKHHKGYSFVYEEET